MKRSSPLSQAAALRVLSVLLVGASLVTLSTACTPKNESRPGAAGQAPAKSADGTGDIGGGNGTKGKVYEQYTVNMLETPEWKEHLAAIDQKMLSLNDDTTSNESILSGIARSLKWYVIPNKLTTLSKEEIGLDITQDPTEQLALQTDREVWIEGESYNASSNDSASRAKLVLHEILMAFYRARFLDFEEVCMRYSEDPLKHCQWDEETKRLIKIAFPLEPKRALEKQDYVNVRAMTDWVARNYSTMTKASLWGEFARNNFDMRFAPPEFQPTLQPSVSGASEKPDVSNVTEEWTQDEVLQAFTSSQILSFSPQYCGPQKGTGIAAATGCKIQADLVDAPYARKAIRLNLTDANGNSQSLTFSSFDSSNASSTKLYFEKQSKRVTLHFLAAVLDENTKAGDRIVDVIMYTSGTKNQAKVEAVMVIPQRVLKIAKTTENDYGTLYTATIGTPNAEVDPVFVFSQRADIVLALNSFRSAERSIFVPKAQAQK